MISDRHKEALAAIKELKGEKVGASMVLELVDLVENLDGIMESLAAKSVQVARAADLVAQDAARWRETLMTITVRHEHFAFQKPYLPAMWHQGSIAGHFTKAIDEARAARDALPGVNPCPA